MGQAADSPGPCHHGDGAHIRMYDAWDAVIVGCHSLVLMERPGVLLRTLAAVVCSRLHSSASSTGTSLIDSAQH